MKEHIRKKDLIRSGIAIAAALVVMLAAIGINKSYDNATMVAGKYTPGTYVGVGQGFGGDVEVTLEINQKGGIDSATLVGASETPTIGGAALEELQNQIVAAQSADIEGVSGASLTSQGTRVAVAKALEQAGGEPYVEEEPVVEEVEVPDSGAYTPGTYTASAQGFGGPVELTITVGDSGAITEATLVGDGETPTVGGAALPELQNQILAAQSAEIDGVAGATITSEAVKAAAADAVTLASGGEIEKVEVAEGALFAAGTYEATARGFGGDITVAVTVTEDEITAVDITGDSETANIGSFAVEMLDDEMLEKQTSMVDALAGATVSSNAIIKAASQALTDAGADVSKLGVAEEPAVRTSEELETDIVIVGAGGAGMTAAINAAQAGKDVILVEKMPYVGGNTTRATAGLNAAGTHYQAEQDVEDSVQQYIDDTMKGGHDLNDKDLVTVLAENSAAAIDWLDSIDAPLPKLSTTGGCTNKRTHAPEDGSGVGAYLVTAFRAQLDALNVKVIYNTAATSIIMEDGVATGIIAESNEADYTIKAGAVILATGGFGGNEDLLVSYRPDLEGYVSTNAPGATGDGIAMAEEAGAAVVDMDQIQLHPTVEQGTRMLITESVRGNGAILVNTSGERFVNEMETRDVVSAAEIAQDEGCAYLIFDQNLVDNLAATKKYFAINVVAEGATITELAEAIEVDPATLAATLETWNTAVANQKDEAFGRTTAMEVDLSVAPYYAIKVAPGIHHCMGGVKINTNAEVIDTEGNVIPGLYAAGEVTGGVHGANRLGGNAVADIVVFGRVASDSAMAYIDGLAPEGEEAEETPEEEAGLTPGTYTGTAQGFGGEVTVTITVDETGKITEATVTGDSETPEIGGAALETLGQQIIDKQGSEIDGVTGASLTSGAAIEAAAAAIAQAAGGAEAAEAEEAGAEGAEAGSGPKAGTYTASAEGFGGDVTVTIVIDETGKITEATVVGDDETPTIGGAALETLGQQIVDKQSPDLDGVSGASVTSGAAREATAAALEQAA